MPLIPFPEYRPDVTDYQSQTTVTLTGVLPRGDGYGPMPGSSAYSSALAAACRGAFVARNPTDGSVAIFAGTATKLYVLDNTALTWTDRSKGAGSYTSVNASENWQFAQFGKYVIAAQANTVPQLYDLNAPGAFIDLAGSPPQARYISTVGRFVVLSGLASAPGGATYSAAEAPYTVHWSGLNAPTTWTQGINSCDAQTLPDGGFVRGVAGGESGLIFQDTAIRRMTYTQDTTIVFQIERIAQDEGLYAPYSLVRAGDRIFWLSTQGFHGISLGGYPTSIGKEKFDRTFLTDLDRGNLQLLIGGADPKSTRVFWAYKSISGAAGLYDKLLCYDWALDRATIIPMTGEYFVSIAEPGRTLESLDTISSSIDALTSSLDSYINSGTPEIAQFDSAHKLAFFRGPNIEALVETSEQGTDSQRLFINGLSPITDATTVYGSCSRRETAQATRTYTTETLVNAVGVCPQHVSARYARGRMRIPAGTNWTFIAGIEPDFTFDGIQ